MLKLLPETAESLQAMAALGQEDLAQYLVNWQQAQAVRLKHLTFQSRPGEIEVIEKALARFLLQARQGAGNNNPNLRGVALYLLCQEYLNSKGGSQE